MVPRGIEFFTLLPGQGVINKDGINIHNINVTCFLLKKSTFIYIYNSYSQTKTYCKSPLDHLKILLLPLSIFIACEYFVVEI